MTKRPSQTALAPISKTTPALRTPANVYLEGLAETSKPAMRGCLKRIARLVNPEAVVSYLELPWHTLRFEEVRILRRKIIEAYPKPGYANVHLAALRGVLKVAWEMDLLDNFPKLAMQLKRLGGMPLHSGQQVAEDDVHKMFAVAEPRDAALIAVMHGAGLRRVEISRLVRKNYDGEILTAFGKKHSQKRIPLLDMDRPVLDRWCKMLPKNPDGPLIPRLRGGKPTKEALTVTAMNLILEDIQRRAGVPQRSPHDFRRSFATALFDAGVDISVVRELMGHVSIATTAIYDLRGERAKIEGMAKLNKFLQTHKGEKP
ncbi:MAG: Integrase/recombinase [Parcubacteria group bacterium GW2011_GWB1_56_8]|nr:MAG: Integrase/recombinase [Parcubacteria group bacterium GW2011_GWB1_56_8]